MINGTPHAETVLLNAAQVASMINRSSAVVHLAIKKGELVDLRDPNRKPGQRGTEARIPLPEAQRWADAWKANELRLAQERAARAERKAQPRAEAAPGTPKGDMSIVIAELKKQTALLEQLVALWAK